MTTFLERHRETIIAALHIAEDIAADRQGDGDLLWLAETRAALAEITETPTPTLGEFVWHSLMAEYLTEARVDSYFSHGQLAEFMSDACVYGYEAYSTYSYAELLTDYCDWFEDGEEPDALGVLAATDGGEY